MVGDSDGNDSEAGLLGEMHIRLLQYLEDPKPK